MLAREVEGDCGLDGRGLEAGAGGEKQICKFNFLSYALTGIGLNASKRVEAGEARVLSGFARIQC